MAFNTNRNNIKVVFWLITKIVVILLCLISATTSLRCWFLQSTFLYGNSYSSVGFHLFGKTFTVTFSIVAIFVSIFAPILLRANSTSLFVPVIISSTRIPMLLKVLLVVISYLCSKARLVFCIILTDIYCSAILAIRLMPILCTFVQMKIIKALDLLTGYAFLVYNGFRHDCFSSKHLCLGPSARTTLALGPFILTTTIFMSILLSEMRQSSNEHTNRPAYKKFGERNG